MKQAAAARSLCHGTALHHAFSTPMHCIPAYCQPKEASCLVNCSYQLFYHSDEFLYQVEVGAHYLVFFFFPFPALSHSLYNDHNPLPMPQWFPESGLSITASEIPVYSLSKLPPRIGPTLIFYLHFLNTTLSSGFSSFIGLCIFLNFWIFSFFSYILNHPCLWVES